jgi:hypothetical protein
MRIVVSQEIHLAGVVLPLGAQMSGDTFTIKFLLVGIVLPFEIRPTGDVLPFVAYLC